MNYVEAQFNRSFYRRPRGGYAPADRGAINISNPALVVRIKGSKAYRPVQNTTQRQAQIGRLA